MIDRVTNCVGCSACACVCPKAAISMKPDAYGFLYPEINADLCISCDVCESVCPALNLPDQKSTEGSYAIVNKQDDIRLKSSSGGVFFSLAKRILDDGGVVFGALFDNDWNVHHTICITEDALDDILRSKYVQSDMKDTFHIVKECLENNQPVLFCGTPCQCNGLSLYLKKKYDNLYLIDFICHGVPSPAIWKKYLESVSQNKSIDAINFRSKDTGWQTYSLRIDYKDGSCFQEKYFNNSYMNLFLADFVLRSSCYDCPAKFPCKESDLTLGDLWGADSIIPSHDNKGVSFVTVNSTKGKRLLDSVQEQLTIETVDREAAFQHNPSARNHAVMPKKRKQCLDELCHCEPSQFEGVAKKYTADSVLNIIKRKAKRTLKKVIKR